MLNTHVLTSDLDKHYIKNRPAWTVFCFSIQMTTTKQLLCTLAFAGVFAVSCTKKTTEKTLPDTSLNTADTSTAREESFAVDSLEIADSAVVSPTLTLEYSQKILLFKGLRKPVLDSLYADMLFPDRNVLPDYSRTSVNKAATERMLNYFKESRNQYQDYMPERPQKWDQHSEMKLHGNQRGYLTVQYTGYGYTGGAHGYAYENYRTADIIQQKNIELDDIVNVKAVPWNQLLLAHLGSRKGELFEPATLTYTQNFFFDQDSLTFVYGQYEIAPYASGIIQIALPLSRLSGALKPEFKERMGIPAK